MVGTKCQVRITRIDMITFHIIGNSDGGSFMFRPMSREIMDHAMCCLGKDCIITVEDAIITEVEAL